MKGLTVVLGYHKVGPGSEEGRFLNVEPRDLGRQVRFLKRRGFRFVQAWELGEVLPGRVVSLTFDDAYLSFLTYGVEVLRKEGVRGSTYVVPGRVGVSSDWDGEIARPLGDWELVREAERAGVEVGNHTMNHVRLGEASVEVQRGEILGAQERLREEGFEAKSFCMPYGSYNEATLEVLREAGFGVGLSVEKGFVGAGDDRTRLRRVMVSYSDRVPGLWYKLFVKPLLKKGRSRA